MRIIKEEQFMKRNVFYCIDADSEGHVYSEQRYDCRTFPCMYHGREVFFIGDRDGNIRFQPFDYVNRIRRGAVNISRRQEAIALQLYYTFCDMFAYDPEHLTPEGYLEFKNFLRGTDVEAMPGSRVTVRDTATVRGYVGLVRAFLRRKEFDVSALADDTDLRGNSVGRLMAPRHLSPEQIRSVAELMAAAGDQATLLAFHIGIMTGLRRGEILGLTLHDIQARPALSVGTAKTSDMVYSLIVRNRPSDDDDRHGKMLRHPDENQVEAREFKRSFYEVPIDEHLYRHIMAFVAATRNPSAVGGRTEMDRIDEATRATGSNDGGGNHYIFYILWRGVYRLLSGRTLNNRLLKYFNKAGVELSNVSHAMRHSFAMYLSYYSPNKVGIKELQAALRHASVQSTMRYFNLTEQQYRKMSNLYSENLTELIPPFKMF